MDRGGEGRQIGGDEGRFCFKWEGGHRDQNTVGAPRSCNLLTEIVNLAASRLSPSPGTTVDQSASRKCQLGGRAALNNPGHHC